MEGVKGKKNGSSGRTKGGEKHDQRRVGTKK
jgi:hypothetical protein